MRRALDGSRWMVRRAVVAGAVAFAASGAAQALEFRSTVDAATILYDGPSVKSQKLFVVPREYPVEVVVTTGNWVKVRDMNGTPLAWVEKKSLGDKRVVAVKVAVADVLAAASADAKVVFKAEQGVILDLVEAPASGWVKVRHRDGQTGYVAISQIWGV